MNTEPGQINESGLTDKQERFAHEYLIDQNASAAALRAGYAPRSHGPQAAALMANPAVRKRVRGLLDELYGQIKLSALRLVQERMATAFFDPRTLVDENNKPKALKDWDAQAAGVMLVSFDTREDGAWVLKARQPSRAAALTALERRFAQFMRMQEEDTITARESDHLYMALGHDPAEIAAGGVARLTPDRGAEWPAPVLEEPAAAELAAVPEPAAQASPQTAAESAPQDQSAAADAADVPAPLAAEADAAVAAIAAQPAPAPARPAAAKVCVPATKASKHGWADGWGNIDVDHPHIPPEVKARELEKRRRRQQEEDERNNRHVQLSYAHSTVGQPNPPWPRPLVQRSTQRFAITEDDPYGTGGSDY